LIAFNNLEHAVAARETAAYQDTMRDGEGSFQLIPAAATDGGAL
jgi:hypothetical protein